MHQKVDLYLPSIPPQMVTKRRLVVQLIDRIAFYPSPGHSILPDNLALISLYLCPNKAIVL